VNIILWIVQIVLALIYLRHGLLLVFPPASATAMIESMGVPPGFRGFIGVAEWLAAAGLILPGLTRILPWLTSAAAAGLVILMTSAVIYHLNRGEIAQTFYTGFLLLLAAFVAYMRWRMVPLPARGRSK
jgi:uncharacterized membrane protein YphA (DoxX/SURF4 family)